MTKLPSLFAIAAAPDLELPMQPGQPTLRIMGVAAAWLALILLAFGYIEVHANTAGTGATAPTRWPAGSDIHFSGLRPTLVMFAHPQCPCTMASLDELEVLLSRYQNRVEAHLVVLNSPGVNVGGVTTRLIAKGETIPGLDVLTDNGGTETDRFQAKTSGTVLLYSAHGELLFNGGITSARGHEGDNASLDAISALLNPSSGRMGRSPIATAVFGCELGLKTQEGGLCRKL